MTAKERETLRQQAAISALQAVIEAKFGALGELAPKVAAREAVALADALVEELEK